MIKVQDTRKRQWLYGIKVNIPDVKFLTLIGPHGHKRLYSGLANLPDVLCS